MKGNNAEGDGTAAVDPGGALNKRTTVTTASMVKGYRPFGHALQRSACFKRQYPYYIAVDAGFQPVFLFYPKRNPKEL